MDATATPAASGLHAVSRTWTVEPSAAGALATRGEVLPFASEALCFRAFRLLPSARILLRHGQPVEIGSRAFDLLHVLLRARGSVVERADIFRHVWPTTTVDDSNLRFQMSCLRKALGEDRELLKTVPGRGYLLAAETGEVGRGFAEGESSVRRAAHAATARSSQDDTAETCERLRSLLRSVLDELSAITREGEPATALAASPARYA